MGGVRGGIRGACSLAAASPTKNQTLAATYAVVLFSVMVQGSTLGTVARRTAGRSRMLEGRDPIISPRGNRPLPPHLEHRPGRFLRPGSGFRTGSDTVPLQASYLVSSTRSPVMLRRPRRGLPRVEEWHGAGRPPGLDPGLLRVSYRLAMSRSRRPVNGSAISASSRARCANPL